MDTFADYIAFEDKDGVENYFIKTVKDKIMVWTRTDKYEHAYVCQALDLNKVNKDILSGIWDKLPESIQEKISVEHETRIEVLKERLAVARGRRRTKSLDLPQELVCSCGHKVKANWTILNKKADALKIPALDLVKNYKCQKCQPTKGRKKKEAVCA